MCESKVFLATDRGEELLLDDVTVIRPERGGYRLVNLFGEQRQIQCRIREIDLLKHRIVMEPVAEEPATQE